MKKIINILSSLLIVSISVSTVVSCTDTFKDETKSSSNYLDNELNNIKNPKLKEMIESTSLWSKDLIMKRHENLNYYTGQTINLLQQAPKTIDMGDGKINLSKYRDSIFNGQLTPLTKINGNEDLSELYRVFDEQYYINKAKNINIDPTLLNGLNMNMINNMGDNGPLKEYMTRISSPGDLSSFLPQELKLGFVVLDEKYYGEAPLGKDIKNLYDTDSFLNNQSKFFFDRNGDQALVKNVDNKLFSINKDLKVEVNELLKNNFFIGNTNNNIGETSKQYVDNAETVKLVNGLLSMTSANALRDQTPLVNSLFGFTELNGDENSIQLFKQIISYMYGSNTMNIGLFGDKNNMLLSPFFSRTMYNGDFTKGSKFKALDTKTFNTNSSISKIIQSFSSLLGGWSDNVIGVLVNNILMNFKYNNEHKQYARSVGDIEISQEDSGLSDNDYKSTLIDGKSYLEKVIYKYTDTAYSLLKKLNDKIKKEQNKASVPLLNGKYSLKDIFETTDENYGNVMEISSKIFSLINNSMNKLEDWELEQNNLVWDELYNIISILKKPNIDNYSKLLDSLNIDETLKVLINGLWKNSGLKVDFSKYSTDENTNPFSNFEKSFYGWTDQKFIIDYPSKMREFIGIKDKNKVVSLEEFKSKIVNILYGNIGGINVDPILQILKIAKTTHTFTTDVFGVLGNIFDLWSDQELKTNYSQNNVTNLKESELKQFLNIGKDKSFFEILWDKIRTKNNPDYINKILTNYLLASQGDINDIENKAIDDLKNNYLKNIFSDNNWDIKYDGSLANNKLGLSVEDKRDVLSYELDWNGLMDDSVDIDNHSKESIYETTDESILKKYALSNENKEDLLKAFAMGDMSGFQYVFKKFEDKYPNDYGRAQKEYNEWVIAFSGNGYSFKNSAELNRHHKYLVKWKNYGTPTNPYWVIEDFKWYIEKDNQISRYYDVSTNKKD